MSSCSRLLDKSRSAIHKSKNNENCGTFGDLHLDPIERNKLKHQFPLFDKFVATLPTKSGIVLIPFGSDCLALLPIVFPSSY